LITIDRHPLEKSRLGQIDIVKGFDHLVDVAGPNGQIILAG
jgi:hypothetical protein